MRVVISGSSGLVGQALISGLKEAGHETISLVRRVSGHGEETWDPEGGALDPGVFDQVDAVVNLSGAGIGDRRWTSHRRSEILRSRVVTTGLLSRILASLDNPPRVLANASAMGFYGDRGTETLTEESPVGTGFLADVCSAWEKATRPAEESGIRVAYLRTGIVLSPDGGALGRLLPLFRAGLGGRLGLGSQWMSWITIGDEIRAILHVLNDDRLSGPVNLTSPNPITNRDFTRALAAALHRPAVLPVPSPLLRAAIGSRRASELLLASQKVTPNRLVDTDFRFDHPELSEALAALLHPGATMST